MNVSSPRLPRCLAVAIPVLVAGYVSWVGPEKFYYESVGTLILSPLIYLRFCPTGLALSAGRFLLDHSWAVFVLCGIPVALLVVAGTLGVIGYRRNSLLLSAVALALTLVVFTTYHWLQPLGFTVFAGEGPVVPGL